MLDSKDGFVKLLADSRIIERPTGRVLIDEYGVETELTAYITKIRKNKSLAGRVVNGLRVAVGADRVA